MFNQTWRAARRVLPTTMFCLALCAVVPKAYALPPTPSPDPGAWVPDSGVSEVVHRGDHTIVAGNFSWWGPYTGAGARIATNSAKPGVVRGQSLVGGGGVLATVPDGAGGAFIGGDFTRVNGEPRMGLAHVSATGTVDPNFKPSVPLGEKVYALSLSGGVLYVGGHFTRMSEVRRTGLAAINTTNGAVTAWSPCVYSSDAAATDNTTVRALAVSNGTVYVGGKFTSLGTMDATSCDASGAAQNLASVSVATGEQTAWRPDPNGTVRALVASGTTLYAGGDFDHVTSGATAPQRSTPR